eukprot:scaffold23274_cov123-Isochrysis_galbana.AAC.1
MAAAQAAEAERQAAATDEAGRQRCAGARDGCDRRDSDARRRCSPNWCAQPSPKRTPIATRHAYEYELLTRATVCACPTAGPSTSEVVQETEDETMDDPEDTEGTGPAAEMDSDHEERELELGWRRRLRVRRDPACVGASHSEAAPPADADAPAPSAEVEAEERDLLRGAGIQGRRRRQRWG